MSNLAQEQGVASPGQGTPMSPERDHIERMNQLEQALEQSLASLSELRQKLTEQQLLETQLVATEEIANLQQQAINELQRQLAALKQDLIVDQTKIETLETQLFGQHTAQAQLQHAYQEMEAKCEESSSRLMQLEEETTLLQEKLLQQAQQASEHETAVHYWKNLYEYRYHQLLELSSALKELLPEHQDELLEIFESIQLSVDIETIEIMGSKLSSMPLRKQPLQVDLPAFLTKNRS